MMPGSCDSEEASSPSLLPSLRNFRFQSKAKYSNSPTDRHKVNSVSSPTVQEQNLSFEKSSPLCGSGNSIVPETPESQRHQSSSSTPEINNGNILFNLRRLRQTSTDTNTSSESTDIKTNSNPNGLSSSELTDTQNEAPKTQEKRAAMDEYEVFCEKEQNLREMLKLFPGADIMEAQDILVSCRWNLNVALEVAKKKPLRTSKKRLGSSNLVESSPNVNRGVVYSPIVDSPEKWTPKAKTVPIKNTSVAEEIVLDSSDESTADNLTNSGSATSSVNSSSTSISINKFRYQSKQTPETRPVQVTESSKKRKRIVVCNDSSDEENPLPKHDNDHLNKNFKSSHVSNTSRALPFNNASHALPFNNARLSELTITPVLQQNTTNKELDNAAQPEEISNTVFLQIPASAEAALNAGQSLKSSKTYSKMAVESPIVERTVDVSVFSDDSMDTPVSESPKKTTKKEPKTKFSKKNVKRKKKYESEEDDDEDYGNDDVYDSEDSDVEEKLTPARSAVLNFFQEATIEELSSVPGCSKKKVDAVVKYRPFTGWVDLVQKLSNDKSLSADLLNGAKKVLDMRAAVSRLMNKCQRIALDMEDLVENLKENKEGSQDYVSTQPELLNDKMHLTPYQMLGLNWLLLMHKQDVNAILADEMGLGKTIQAISFLAYLKEQSISGPHLVVVPSSTLDNWKKEFQTWWPSVNVLCYRGSQDSRRDLRQEIINDEAEEFDVMVTTYNMVTSSAEDRNFFKKLEFHYVIFDEAHMLKNMASQRYQHLMRVKGARRLLLTGTPLQNNLVELMSLLIFAMPNMFFGKTEHIRQMFSAVCKSDDGKTKFEKERIEHAKRIMKPFVLRRLKSEVLQDLPKKKEEVRHCPMSESQAGYYTNLVAALSEEVKKNEAKDITNSGAGMMMKLRKAANHALLLRNHFDDGKLLEMSKLMIKEESHKEASPDLIFEDMAVMSDFELYKLSKMYKSLKSFPLSHDTILDSGKFAVLDELLPEMIQQEHRILLFSQFTMVLDIIEEYMAIRKHKYLRLDGQTPVSDRQQLIDEFNEDSNIPIFLLSTKAGGLGINLTAADVVIIHDIDFNPYNDKQAEDRCHRVGQLRDVTVIRLISKDTIEEGMLLRANEKLKLEKDIIHEKDGDEEKNSGSVAKLLRDALGISTSKS